MSLTATPPLPAFLLLLILSASPLPIYAGEQAKLTRPGGRTPSTRERIAVYAPRVRRATITYLRLRLLELREEDLERARAAIERRLTVDELINRASGGHAAGAEAPSRRRESTP